MDSRRFFGSCVLAMTSSPIRSTLHHPGKSELETPCGRAERQTLKATTRPGPAPSRPMSVSFTATSAVQPRAYRPMIAVQSGFQLLSPFRLSSFSPLLHTLKRFRVFESVAKNSSMRSSVRGSPGARPAGPTRASFRPLASQRTARYRRFSSRKTRTRVCSAAGVRLPRTTNPEYSLARRHSGSVSAPSSAIFPATSG